MGARLGKVWDKFIGALFAISCGLAAGITLLIVYSVVMRYFFHNQPGWSLEIAGYSMSFIAFLGASWLLKNEGHISMDFLTARLSTSAKSILNGITSCILAGACLTMTWFGTAAVAGLIQRKEIFSAVLDVPKAPIIAMIPFSLLLLAIQFSIRAATLFKRAAAEDARKS